MGGAAEVRAVERRANAGQRNAEVARMTGVEGDEVERDAVAWHVVAWDVVAWDVDRRLAAAERRQRPERPVMSGLPANAPGAA
jgi:hypothetical protein